ncbi:MAG: hypothetical protein AAB407_01460 [Patescibacteria group bacterium]
MRNITKQIIFNSIFFVLGISLFFLARTSYGGWINFSNNNPPQLNVAEPLNVGPVGQTKLGRLDLNTNKTALSGLELISGRVGIGTNNPQELLDVNGNVGLTGSLVMSGGFGSKDDILANVNALQQLWVSDIAWLTIQRIDTYDAAYGGCMEIFPICPSGWIMHELFPVSPPPCTETLGTSSIGKQTRICKKGF